MVFYTLAIGLLAVPSTAEAAVPDSIGYQGRLKNAAGTPIAAGTYDLRFQFYSALAGGASLATVDADDVIVANGFFSTEIDLSTVADSIDNFTSAMFLEVLVKEDAAVAYDTLSPRVEMFKTPYSIFTQAIENLAAAPAEVFNGRTYYNTVTNDLHWYDGAAWNAVASTLDKAYDNFGAAAQIITVDDAATGLSFDVTDAGNMTVDLQSTGDFEIQNNNSTWASFSDTEVFDVNGTGAISLDADAASNFNTSAGDLTLDSETGSVNMDGGEAVADAVRIVASDVAGGIDVDAGTAGIALNSTGSVLLDAAGINLEGNAAEIDVTTLGALDMNSAAGTWDLSAGLSLDAAAASNFNTSVGTLTIATTAGAAASSLILQSADTSDDAIYLDVDDQAGSGITLDAYDAVTNTTGIITLDGESIDLNTFGPNGLDIDVGDGGTLALDTTNGSLSLTGGGAAGSVNATSTQNDVIIDTQTGSRSISIGTSNVARNINIGTGQGGDVVNFGSAIAGTDQWNFQTFENTNNAMDIIADSMTTANVVDISADALTSGQALNIDSQSAWTDSLVRLDNTGNAAWTGNMIDLNSGGGAPTGDYINIVNEANAVATQGIVYTNQAASNVDGWLMDVDSSAAFTGNMIDFDTTAGYTGTLFNIDNSGNQNANGGVFRVRTGTGDPNASFAFVSIESGATSYDMFNIDNNAASDEDGWFLDMDTTGAWVGNMFDIDLSAAVSTADVFNVTYTDVAHTGNAIDLNMGTNVAGDAINITSAATSGSALQVAASGVATADIIDIDSSGLVTTNGVDALDIAFATGDGADPTNAVIRGVLTSGGTAATDIGVGLYLDLAAGSNGGATDTAIDIEGTSTWDFDLDLQNDLTISNSDDNDLDITENGVSLNFDFAESSAATISMRTDSDLDIVSSADGSDAIQINALNGGLTIMAQGEPGENLSITGSDAKIFIDSTEGSNNAIRINASHATGGIDIDAGTTGIRLDSDGTISLDADLASNFNTSIGDLTFDSETGSVIIDGGEGVADAITIVSATGGVDVDAALQINVDSSQAAADAIRLNASSGGIDIDSGTGGIAVNTTSTTADAIDIEATGIVAGTAINLETTDGGIEIDANGAANGDLLVGVEDDANLTIGGLWLNTVTGTYGVDATDAVTVDSDAAMTLGGLTVAMVADGGVMDIDATAALSINSSTAAINIGDDAVAANINVGTGGNRVITVGSAATTQINLSTDDADATDVNVTGSMTISNDLAVVDGLDVDGATTLDQVTIDTTDAAFVVGGANTITLGDSLGTVSIDSSDWDISTTGDITGAGAITADGLVTGSLGADFSGAAINLNNNSNFGVNINTGTSTGALALGGGLGTVEINSVNWDITAAGAMTGITDLSMSGDLDVDGATTLDQVTIDTTDAAFAVGGANTITLGDNNGTVSIDSSDWDISTTGDITGAGAITADGLVTGSLGADISGAAINLNSNSNFGVNINTGTSTGTVAIGGTAGNTINVGTDNTVADTISIGSVLDAVAITGDDWSVTDAGAAAFGSTLDVDGATTLDQVTIDTTDAAFAVGGANTITLGDNNGTVSIDSSDWDISTTGDITGAGAITADGLATITIDDATTNAVTDVLIIGHSTSGAVAQNIGTGISIFGEDAGGSEEQASIDMVITGIADGAETSDLVFSTQVAGIVSEILRLDGANQRVNASAGIISLGLVANHNDPLSSSTITSAANATAASTFEVTHTSASAGAVADGDVAVSFVFDQLDDGANNDDTGNAVLDISATHSNEAGDSMVGLNIADLVDSAGTGNAAINIGSNWGTSINLEDTAASIGFADGGSLEFGAVADRMMTLSDAGTTGFLNVTGGTAIGAQIDLTLGFGVTAVDATDDSYIYLEGDGGGNVVSTITGGVDGQILVLEFDDALIDLDCTAVPGADQIACGTDGNDLEDLAAGDQVTLIRNGVGWRMISYFDISDDHDAGNGFDIAEWFPATEELSAGDVVTASYTDPVHVSKSAAGYERGLLGIVATQPGIVLGDSGESQHAAQVALAGRVPVNFSNENGEVATGDFLTSSATRPGYAMKATATGPTIGMAMESSTAGLQLMVKVDNMWYTPPTSESNDLQGGNSSALSSADSFSVTDGVFSGSVTVAEHLYGSRDMAGRARLKAGDNSVRVAFDSEYAHMPIVTFSLRTDEHVPGRVFVSNEDTTGFTINHSAGSTTPYALEFNWIAVGVEEATVSVSDGTTENVSVSVSSAPAPVVEEVVEEVVAEEPAEEEAPAEESAPAEEAVEEAPAEEVVEEVVAEEPAEESAPAEEAVEEAPAEEVVEEVVAEEPAEEEAPAEESAE